MSDTIHFRELSTAQIPFQLFSDGTPIDLSGVTKTMIVLVPANGTGTAIKYDTSTNPTILAYTSAANGRISYSPQGADLLYASTPYKVFFWVYTSASLRYAVPDGEELTIEVSNDFE